ncbi:hypothetical protein J6Y73_05630 [bacterium]|nr:hypothetical protein [bacterium]
MRCLICEKPIFYDISFKDLFSFRFICSKCLSITKEKTLIIPINHGHILKYKYFLDDEYYSQEIEKILYTKLIKILKENKKDLILFIDDDTLPFIKYLEFGIDITLISITYNDLEYLLEDVL